MQRTVQLPIVALCVAAQQLLIQYCRRVADPLQWLEGISLLRLILCLILLAAIIVIFAVIARLCDGVPLASGFFASWLPRYGRWMRLVLLLAAIISIPLLVLFFFVLSHVNTAVHTHPAGTALLVAVALVILPLLLHTQFRLFLGQSDTVHDSFKGLRTHYLPLLGLTALFLIVRVSLSLLNHVIPPFPMLVLTALPGTVLHWVLLRRYHVRGARAANRTLAVDRRRFRLCTAALSLLFVSFIAFSILSPSGIIERTHTIHILAHAVCTAFPLGVLGCIAVCQLLPKSFRIVRQVLIVVIVLLVSVWIGLAVLNFFIPVWESYRVMILPFLS